MKNSKKRIVTYVMRQYKKNKKHIDAKMVNAK